MSIEFSANAQSYTGFASGNFSGAIGADVNPASVADNIYKIDLTIVGANVFFDNNYQGFDYRNNFSAVIPRSSDVRYGYISNEFRLPSFMYSISPTEGVAFSPKLRTVFNANNFTPELTNAIADEFNNPSNFSETFFNQGGSMDAMSWQEYAATYGRVLKFTEEHYFKAGASLKLLLPMASTYTFLNTLSYESLSNDRIELNEVQFEFSNSQNIDNVTNNGSFSRAKGFAFGLDLGLVYENRPRQRYNPTYSKGKDFTPTKRNDRPYRYRLSAAILDIGRMKFNHGQNAVSSGGITQSTVDIEQSLRGIGNVEGYIDSIRTILTTDDLTGTYTMGLPTRLRLSSDINFHNGFYLNSAVELSLRAFKFSDRAVHTISSLTLTPRYETDVLGAYIPIYINVEGQVNLGVAFRAGPLVIGSHNVVPFITGKSIESTGVYVVLKTFSIKKNRVKEELKCEDIYVGWRQKKSKAPRRASKNVGDSPKVKGQ